MKKTPVMKHLTHLNLKMNRKRTIVTVIGIILATALLTAVATMASSLQTSLVSYQKQKTGSYHYVFGDVPSDQVKRIEDNRNVAQTYKKANIGYASLPDSINEDKPYLYLIAMDQAAMENSSVKLLEGRLPQNDHELLLSRHIKTNGGVDYKVGDTLDLNISKRLLSDGSIADQNCPYTGEERLEPEFEASFTVVGITARLDEEVEDRMAPGYTVITCMNLDGGNIPKKYEKEADVYALYTKQGLKNRAQVTADIIGADPSWMKQFLFQNGTMSIEEIERNLDACDYSFTENTYLIRYETLDFRESMFAFMYSVIAVVITIIVVASVFCISNSFAISITEKMKLYGMLASVGATPGQIKKNVRYEAFLLGVAAIPIGLFSGVFACFAVIWIINYFFPEGLYITLEFHTSWTAILAGAVLSAVTIYLSAEQPAKKAAKVSPIAAMHGQSEITIRKKEVSSPGWVKKFFGAGGVIAYKNMKRNRRKYRVSMLSIIVSVTIFIALFSFMDMMVDGMQYYTNRDGANLILQLSDWQNNRELLETSVKENGVEKAVLERSTDLVMPEADIPYTEESEHFYPEEYRESYEAIRMISLGDTEYRSYLKKLGLDYDTVKDQAILLNDSFMDQDGKTVSYVATSWKQGDTLNGWAGAAYGSMDDGTLVGADGEAFAFSEEQKATLTIAKVTEELPFGETRYFRPAGLLIVSDAWMDAHVPDNEYTDIRAGYRCENADELQDVLIEDYGFSEQNMINQDEEQRQTDSLLAVVSIFLYGFITIISLIGITNIFNTITTSMELRSREFAMLRSIGMTGKEFRRMIFLENLFSGVKALAVGILLGCGLSYLIYWRLADGMDTGYQLPVFAIFVSVIAVALLLSGIMQYSLAKLHRQNLIETIRTENI